MFLSNTDGDTSVAGLNAIIRNPQFSIVTGYFQPCCEKKKYTAGTFMAAGHFAYYLHVVG